MQLKQQLEPCMRITVQIPKDAAQRLRQLAAEGNASLRALGIHSVQLEGDSLISLNLSGQQIDVKVSETLAAVGTAKTCSSVSDDAVDKVRNTDISDLSQILSVGNVGGTNASSGFAKLSQGQLQQQQNTGSLLQQQQRSNNIPNINFGANVVGNADGTLSLQQQQMLQQRRNMMLGGPSTSNAALKQQNSFNSVLGSLQLQQPVFKSPNTVCPMDGKVPVPPSPISIVNFPNSREFPFESMRQARVLQGRDNSFSTVGPSSTTALPTAGGIPLSTVKQTVAVTSGNGAMHHQLMNSAGPPPNVALKVIKNPQSGEMITTTISTASGKSHFMQPPPPPYPGVATVTSPSSQNSSTSVKPITNFLQSRVPPLLTSTASSSNTGVPGNSNNIAMSSPLLVNLLQNDNHSVANQPQSNQVKLSPLPSPQHQPQHHHQQQLSLLNQQQQQQQSPMMAGMSPQQPVMNSPLRTATPGSEFIMQPHSNQVQQQIIAAPSNSDNVLTVPSSPTAVSNSVRSIAGSQQIMLSPSNSNMYTHQQQQTQQRFPQHQQPQQQQQQISPKQAALLRQRQQQLQVSNQLQNQQRFTSQQQQVIQQSLGVNAMLGNQQQQMRQLRVGSGGGVVTLSHQTPSSPLQQQQLQQHQPRLIGQQPQPYISSNSDNLSPATAHSPASSHHSLHSPHMSSQHPHQQQLLSPSTTPTQSPLTSSHLPQQLLPPPQSPSSGVAHNTSSSSIHTVPSSPSTPSMNLPPPPDYNQAAASSRWPVTLNKPMDSATKSSFQEFTRYQMQYNLQQQQTQKQQQQIISEIANSLPGASTHSNHLQPSAGLAIAVNGSGSGCSNVLGVGNASSSISNNISGANTASQNVDDLTDPLITLSDLADLTTNDLDALLPTLSCDIDSSLSLDDKNELESLLQDAKDLDLDILDGMDMEETAAAASSFLSSDEQLQSSVTLTMDQLQSQQQLLQQQSHDMQLSVHQQRQLQVGQSQNILQQQQSQLILQQRLQQQQHQLGQQNNLSPNQQHQQFLFSTSLQQQPFSLQKQPQQHSISSDILPSASVSTPSNAQTVPPSPQNFLINPLTGELEPCPSDDSETEAEQETLKSRNSAIHNISNAPAVSQGTSYVPNNCTNSIYELLPNSSNFSEDSNSNSCSTAISKLSAGEQNNGGSLTPQLMGTGSDTERSRDSLISNKSQKNRKSKGNLTSTGNININVSVASSKHGDMSSPRSNSSSPSVGAMLSGGNASNKKSKTNLLREKLQQGLREKKNKEAVNAGGSVKQKRERAKSGSKSKAALAGNATTPQIQTHSESKQNSAIISNLISATTTLSTNTTTTMINTMDNAVVQSGCANVTATEKIKLRLKLGKSEPVSPAYKVDVTFGSENMHQQQQQSQHNAQQLANSIMQQKQIHSNHTHHTSSSQFQHNSNISIQHQQSLQQVKQQLTQQQQSSMNPPQYQHHESTFSHPTSSSLAEGSGPISGITNSASNSSTIVDEPRVPPLHISLRGGKSSIVIKNSRKERKKTQSTTVSNDSNSYRITVESDPLDSNKTKSHLKRTHIIAENTISNVKSETSLDEQSETEAKQSKLVQNVGKSSISQLNGMPNLSSQTHSNAENKLSSTLISGKNGLTISSTAKTTVNNAPSECNKGQNLLMETQNLVSTNLGTVTNLPPQQLLQPSTQQQLAKLASLPNSITLSTITNPNNSGGSGSIGTNSNSLQVKHNLKTTATITPIQGKPLTKNHKPPSYITAVQQLQLQKQQQQQQLAALAEKQTQQQMIAAAVTMLPSATTLKRVEITKVERKDAMGNVEHVLIKSNEPVMKTTASVKANPPVNTSTGNSATTTISPPSSSVSTSSLSTNAKISVSVGDTTAGKAENSISATRNISNHTTCSAITTGSITAATVVSVSVPNVNTNINYNNQSSIVSVLRNSPASTGGGTPAHTNSAGGEDSGIESMDALSEKSPHQLTSSSPQSLQPQITSEKPPQQLLAKIPTSETLKKTGENATTQLRLADDEIEKALAKMEGFTDDDDNNLSVGESLKSKDDETFKTHQQQQLNGDLSIFENDTKDNKVVYNNIHNHNLDEDDDDDDEDLIKNLTASIIEEHEAGEKAAKEKLEHERKEKLNFELQDKKEELNKYKLRDIKAEDFEEKIIHTTTIIKKDDSIKIEINCNNNNNKEKSGETKKTTMEFITKVEEKDSNINKQIDPIHSNLSTPISIEIPQVTDNDSPRIRTRASSRLGSPLDVVKSSPSLDSNISSQSTSHTKHVSTRSSSHTNERVSISPKLQSNSSSSTIANTTVNSSCANTLNNSNSNQSMQNHHKRKRRESESSSNSGNFESDPKRARSSSTGGSAVVTIINHNEPISKKSDDGVLKSSGSTTKKIEESSDSDEPLIEVAGKVRNSKVTIGNVDTNSSMITNVNSVASTSPSHSFISTMLENSSEKVTRNSRSYQNKTPAAQMIASVVGIDSTSNLGISATSKNGKLNNGVAGQANNNPNISNTTVSNSSSLLVSNSTSSASNLITSHPPSHATRGACQSTAGTSISAVSSNTTTNVNNSSNSPSDEKIGTRRSVRASAAANKIIYTRGIHNSANNSSGNNENSGKVVGKTAVLNTSSESVAEARRKTRSAVVGESSLTEGRRRRGSRDYK